MFALYKKTINENIIKYTFEDTISIFGCNVGYIPKMLRGIIKKTANEPYEWQLLISDALTKMGIDDRSIIIDVKPKDHKEVLLCELIHVYGFSLNEWTPALFKLRCLIEDEPVDSINKESFIIENFKQINNIITFTSFAGSVKNGTLTGTWNPPSPSPTNSVLLWPDIIEYFKKFI